jgi:aspartate kinase
MKGPPVVVVKFGGAALERREAVIERVRSLHAEGCSAVVVVSARSGVTDRLVDTADHPGDRRRHSRTLEAIVRRHPGLSSHAPILVAGFRGVLTEIETGAGHADRVDRLLSYGERFSAAWVAAALGDAGLAAVAVEADRAGLVVRQVSDRVEIDPRAAAGRFASTLRHHLGRGRTPVVTGYFGRVGRRGVATLGRGGSDYSATAIAAVLEARRVELIKRDAPVLSADPASVPGAFVVPRLSYGEAEELARFGARVLHPLTLAPVRPVGLEVWVRALDDLNEMTVIGPSRVGESCRAVTSLSSLSLLQVRLPSGSGRASAVARLAAELSRDQIPVVAWLTAPEGVGVVLDSRSRAMLGGSRAGLVPADRPASPPIRVDLVTVVGEGAISEYARIPRSVLRLVRGVAVSSRSLTFAVPPSQGTFALRAIHAAVVEPTRPGSARSSMDEPSPDRSPGAAQRSAQLRSWMRRPRSPQGVATTDPRTHAARAEG